MKMHLSPRQKQIVDYVGKGGSYAEVGAALKLSPATVKTYTELISDKLGGNLPAKLTVVLYYRIANKLDIFSGEPLTAIAESR